MKHGAAICRAGEAQGLGGRDQRSGIVRYGKWSSACCQEWVCWSMGKSSQGQGQQRTGSFVDGYMGGWLMLVWVLSRYWASRNSHAPLAPPPSRSHEPISGAPKAFGPSGLFLIGESGVPYCSMRPSPLMLISLPSLHFTSPQFTFCLRGTNRGAIYCCYYKNSALETHPY